MPELIDRTAIMEQLGAIEQNSKLTDAQKFRVAKFTVGNAQTIKPEVRHGWWKGWTTSKFTGKYKDYDEPEFKDYVYCTCSECYRKSAIQEMYCPQCGARMDGGADNG